MGVGIPNNNDKEEGTNIDVVEDQGCRPPYAEAAWSTDSMDQLRSSINPSSRQSDLDFYLPEGIVGEMVPTDILNSFLSTGNPWEGFPT